MSVFLHRKSILIHPRHLQVLGTRPKSTLGCGGKKAGKKWVGEEMSMVSPLPGWISQSVEDCLSIYSSMSPLRTNSANLSFLNHFPHQNLNTFKIRVHPGRRVTKACSLRVCYSCCPSQSQYRPATPSNISFLAVLAGELWSTWEARSVK